VADIAWLVSSIPTIIDANFLRVDKRQIIMLLVFFMVIIFPFPRLHKWLLISGIVLMPEGDAFPNHNTSIRLTTDPFHANTKCPRKP